MRHEFTSEDTGELAEHRAALPAVAWAIALAVACAMSWLDVLPQHTSQEQLSADTAASAAPLPR